MQTISIQKASDLSAAVKAAVEQLLGRTIAADVQDISAEDSDSAIEEAIDHVRHNRT